jgi:hypothetical protein
VIRSAARNRIEDGTGIGVYFFHLDRQSSKVRLNADLETTMTVIADRRYQSLGAQLRGYRT